MSKTTVSSLLLAAFAFLVAMHPSLLVAQEGDQPSPPSPLPLSSPSSIAYNSTARAWSIIHERARIEANGRLMRMEFNKSIGHSPARPNLNASYMSSGSRQFFIPGREQFVNAGLTRSWYW